MHIVHGDLTTMKGKIKDNVANIVRSYANSTHLQKSDFQEIIHIVDLDGVYISDDDVIGDSVAVEPIYSTTEIRTCNPEGIKFRNELKRKNLDVISSIQTVWGGVTYHAFYMSCNLEHVLYNKLNCSDLEKECYAHNFAKKFSRDLPAFVTFIAKSSFSVPGTYIETWKFIKQKKIP